MSTTTQPGDRRRHRPSRGLRPGRRRGRCITSRPATGHWSSCCTASRSSGTAGGSRSHRSRGRASASSLPDLRGYNLSSKPDAFADYTADKLAEDVRGLIRELGAESAMVVGHDWGGTVAWALAMNHPEVVDRLVILNAAHPRKLNEGLRNLRQLLRTWYFFYFQTPRLPERRARRRHWRFFKRFLRDARPPHTEQEIDRYVEAWSQPGAAKAMIDYYRAAVRLGSKQEIRPISAPTLVIWGQGDRYLGPKLAEPHHEDVPNLDRVERLPDASHWVHHDEAERVNELLVDFLA